MGVVVEVWLDVCVWRKKCMAVSMQEIVQVSVWRAAQLSVLGVVSSLEMVCFWRFHCTFLFTISFLPFYNTHP